MDHKTPTVPCNSWQQTSRAMQQLAADQQCRPRARQQLQYHKTRGRLAVVAHTGLPASQHISLPARPPLSPASQPRKEPVCPSSTSSPSPRPAATAYPDVDARCFVPSRFVWLAVQFMNRERAAAAAAAAAVCDVDGAAGTQTATAGLAVGLARFQVTKQVKQHGLAGALGGGGGGSQPVEPSRLVGSQLNVHW